jgi:excisionase family DNA binding protein
VGAGWLPPAGSVILEPAAAFRLMRLHRIGDQIRQNARRDGTTVDPITAHALALLEASAQMYQPPAVPGKGPLVAFPHGSDGSSADADTVMMTTLEASKILGLSSRQVRNLIADGHLAGVRCGGRWLVPAELVHELEQLRSVA